MDLSNILLTLSLFCKSCGPDQIPSKPEKRSSDQHTVQYRPQKMPSLQFLNMFGRQLTRMKIATSVPLTFSLVGLQAIMDVKFSCPCKAGWNKAITALIFIVPALFAFVIMFVLLRPCPFKYSCQKNTFEASKDCEETSQGDDNKKTPQEHLKHCKKCRVKTFLVCLIPSLVWICIFLIDGDYIACGSTTCNGRYACDKELHPHCLNWCKPTESPEINETECYGNTRQLIYQSKIAGYSLAIIFCIIAIILLTFDWDGSVRSKSCSTESSTPEDPKPDAKDKAITDVRNTEITTENTSLLSGDSTEKRTVTKDEASPTIIPMSNIESAPEEAS